MPDDIAARFHRTMVALHERTKRETGYNATYFARMVGEVGGVEAARKLLATDAPSDGFTKLWELKRLDLSVEAHVVLDEYATLFSSGERRRARRRLLQYGYDP